MSYQAIRSTPEVISYPYDLSLFNVGCIHTIYEYECVRMTVLPSPIDICKPIPAGNARSPSTSSQAAIVSSFLPQWPMGQTAFTNNKKRQSFYFQTMNFGTKYEFIKEIHILAELFVNFYTKQNIYTHQNTKYNMF